MSKRFWFAATGTLRRLWALTVWRVLVVVCCRSIRIEGRHNVPDEPVVVVANHASHADTVLIQYVLATCHSRPVLVAGAEDYWFRRRGVGAAARLLGVFAFPRRGEVGVRRAERALRKGASVVLFPQGSRSGGRFRSGVGRLARHSNVRIVPIHLDGPAAILPKSQHWPRRADVTVRIGVPTSIHPAESAEMFADRLQRIVQRNLAVAA